MRRFMLSAALVAALSLVAATAAFAGGVIHHVSAGTADACFAFGARPGCDANFSLVADQYANGSVKGQFTDRSKRLGGFTASIDCLSINGTEAWVSGVITSGTFAGEDLTGLAVSTMVKDNGTTANDPPDQISFTYWGGDLAFSCTTQSEGFGLLDAPQGQVTVR